jgi:hypothetical protein
MKKLILLLLALTTFHHLHAQEYLAFAKKGDKYGYIDTKGNWVIQPTFKDAKMFSEGLAAVKMENEYGYINKSGKFITEQIYTNALEFRDGYAIVKKAGGWGVIDTTGAAILNCEYGFIDNFSCGYAKVKHPQWCFVKKGGEVLKTIDFSRCESFREGMARVQYKGDWGFIDTTGAYVVKAEYHAAGDFSNGFALVNRNLRIGYINKKGVLVVEPKYDFGKDFEKGRARVLLNNCWSWIDTTGKTILNFNQDVLCTSKYHDGFARLAVGGRQRYINKSGKFIFKNEFTLADDFYSNVAIVKKNGNYLLIDTLGRELTTDQFKALSYCENNYIRAETSKGTGFIDRKGNWMIKPEFSTVGVFTDVNRKRNKPWLTYAVPVSTFDPYINDFR